MRRWPRGWRWKNERDRLPRNPGKIQKHRSLTLAVRKESLVLREGYRTATVRETARDFLTDLRVAVQSKERYSRLKYRSGSPPWHSALTTSPRKMA